MLMKGCAFVLQTDRFFLDGAGNSENDWSVHGESMEILRRRRKFVELRMKIDDGFIGNLQTKLKTTVATDIVREALTIFNWAVQERERGRVILSADPDGKNVVRLAMPVLERIKHTEVQPAL